jgi:hypothetical protein
MYFLQVSQKCLELNFMGYFPQLPCCLKVNGKVTPEHNGVGQCVNGLNPTH